MDLKYGIERDSVGFNAKITKNEHQLSFHKTFVTII